MEDIDRCRRVERLSIATPALVAAVRRCADCQLVVFTRSQSGVSDDPRAALQAAAVNHVGAGRRELGSVVVAPSFLYLETVVRDE